MSIPRNNLVSMGFYRRLEPETRLGNPTYLTISNRMDERQISRQDLLNFNDRALQGRIFFNTTHIPLIASFRL